MQLVLEFRTLAQSQLDFLTQDTHTQLACATLALRGVYTTQPTHCTITLEDSRDSTLALLLLSASSAYTVRIQEV